MHQIKNKKTSDPISKVEDGEQCDQMWRFRPMWHFFLALFWVPLVRKILEVAIAPQDGKSGTSKKGF